MIVGAGAVGGAIGGALALAGCEIALVARGAHLEAIRAHGLRLVTPERSETLPLPAFASAHEARADESDAVIVATKSADTVRALAGIAWRTPIFCAQNGVSNERAVAERFEHAYGMLVFAPLSHLSPGVVTIHSAPSFGGIDVGRWPDVVDLVTLHLVDDLARGGFDARPRQAIARWKYGKLLTNLGNVLEALGGRAALRPEWIGAANDEGEACLRAAGIAFVPAAEIHARFADVREVLPRGGGSTWQSLARGLPLETEHLNGEIVRLGRAHGVATPMNEALLALAARATEERWAPGARSVDELSAWLAAAAPSRAPT